MNSPFCIRDWIRPSRRLLLLAGKRLGGYDDHGDRSCAGVGFQRIEHGKAVHSWQHQVEQDQIGRINTG